MYCYQLISNHEWQILADEYLTSQQKTQHYLAKPKRIKHFYDNGYDDIVKQLVNNPESCKNFYSLLQQVGLPYQSYYDKSVNLVSHILKTALFSETLILIELPVQGDYREFSPEIVGNPILPMSKKESVYEPDDSWIIVDLINHLPEQLDIRDAAEMTQLIVRKSTSPDEIFLKHDDTFSTIQVLPKVHILLGGKQGDYDLAHRGNKSLRVKNQAQAWLDELSELLRSGNSPFSIEQDKALASVINHGFSSKHNPSPNINTKALHQNTGFRPDERIGLFFYQLLLALNKTYFITAKQRIGDLAYDESEGAITDNQQLKQAIKALHNLRHSEGYDKHYYAYISDKLAKVANEYLNQPLILDGSGDENDYESKLKAQIEYYAKVDRLSEIGSLYFNGIKLLKQLREPGIIKHINTRQAYQLKTTKLSYQPVELKMLDFISLKLHRNYRYQISSGDNSAQFFGRFSPDDKLNIKIPAKYAHISEWNITTSPVENEFIDEFFPTLKNQYTKMFSMSGFTVGESDVGIMDGNTLIGPDKSLSNLTASAQVAGGAVSLYFAAVIGATGVGAPLASTIGFIGLDNLQSGTRTLLSQDTTTTYGAQFLEWAGVPKGYGEIVYAMLDISTITKAGYAIKATNQTYNIIKVKPISTAKPQQAIQAEELSISIENITKNEHHVVELKNADDLSKDVASLQELAKNEMDTLVTLYNNKNINPKDFTISINHKILTTDKTVSIGAPVFKGASEADVMAYFKQLSGINNMPTAQIIPEKGIVYSVKVTAGPNAGSRVALRDFSNSSSQTNAKWTIDIQNPNINKGNKVEVKFQ